ncbi:TIR domain-containing protein [Marivirga sp. S37H4]|uniref:TIR domain-containing protein n=1 Tax=Marivirga aurantiaca TaxID=2802615 RepID=A0A934WVA4_9BACT|nr:TIR domain-containing protein [Marivirga aurantiaca]MBK6263688.1 TIR domain-containing protein [Marivirga aurantiaca]
MARETFIAYKYDEASDLRDEIIEKLGDDSRYYQGETAESPDMSGDKIDRIKNSLKDMIFQTSVTIVIISPNLKNSNWVDWEIQYSLKEYKRQSTTSRTNGIVGVIMKYNGSYDWLISRNQNQDGCTPRVIDDSKLYDIVNNNRYNLNTDNKYSCPNCQSFDQLNGSYIALVEEENFLNNPSHYIENAYNKSKESWNYNLSKQR